MRADNTAHLVTSARRRHELARAKAIRTLRQLAEAGTPVTFEIVLSKAEVSRSWLYTQPDIRHEIEQLRALGHRAPKAPVPARQRSSDSSLLNRLEIANARNRKLAEDNKRLRRQLAETLGLLRAAGVRSTSEPAPELDSARCS